MNETFYGLRVQVGMSDPWDFVTENGSLVMGTIIRLHDGQFQIELDTPVKSGGLTAQIVFGSFRHVGYTPASLLSGESVPFNFSSCSKEGWSRLARDEWFGFIGGLKLEAHA